MSSWTPVSGLDIQKLTSTGVLASGYYLKFYKATTNTAILMATDSTGGTTLAKAQVNSSGQLINGSGDTFVPHINESYRYVWYANATDADNNTFGNAVDDVDNNEQLQTGSTDLWGPAITATQVDADTFTVVGDQTSILTVGQRVKFDDSSTLFGKIRTSTYTTLTTCDVVLDSGALSGSLTNVYPSLATTAQKEISAASVAYRNRVTANTIIRSAEHRMRDVPHIRDWVPDLAGTNDYTTEFQRAIDECGTADESGNDYAYLKCDPGRLLITSPITVPEFNFTLAGPENSRLELIASAGFPTTGHRGVIEIPPNGQFINFVGITIDCNTLAQYGWLTPVSGISTDDRSHLRFVDCNASKATQVCMALACWMSSLTNVRLGGNGTASACLEIGKITVNGVTSAREGTTTDLTNVYALQANDFGIRCETIAGLHMAGCSVDNCENASTLPFAYRFTDCKGVMNGCNAEINDRAIDFGGTASIISIQNSRLTRLAENNTVTSLIAASGGQISFQGTDVDTSAIAAGRATSVISTGAAVGVVTYDPTGTDFGTQTNSLSSPEQLHSISPRTSWRGKFGGNDATIATGTDTKIYPIVEDYDVGDGYKTWSITNISQAATAVVTYTDPGNSDLEPANGDVIYINGVVGMVEVNDLTFTIANVNTTANTFELSGINSTGYTAYTSGGTATDGKYTVPAADLYTIGGLLRLNVLGAGKVFTVRVKDGGSTIYEFPITNGNSGAVDTVVNINNRARFNKGDVLTFHVEHDHGSDLELSGDNNETYLFIDRG